MPRYPIAQKSAHAPLAEKKTRTVITAKQNIRYPGRTNLNFDTSLWIVIS